MEIDHCVASQNDSGSPQMDKDIVFVARYWVNMESTRVYSVTPRKVVDENVVLNFWLRL